MERKHTELRERCDGLHCENEREAQNRVQHEAEAVG